MKASNWLLAALAGILALAALVVFPLDKGLLGNKPLVLGLDLQGGKYIVYQADLTGIPANQVADTMDGEIAVLANRINPLGVTEPLIEKQGTDRIAVQLPGTTLTEEQQARLGSTAILEFREQSTDAEGNTTWIPATGTVDGQELVLSSKYFQSNTEVRLDQTTNQPYLYFQWDETGAQLSEQVTTRLQGKQLGIYEGDQPLLGEDGLPIAPVVNAVITDSGIIEGLSLKEALDLSSILNAGRLQVPLTILYDETVSPTLGRNFVELSVLAGGIGIALIFLLMSLYYKVPGLVSSMALLYYGVVLLAIFKLFGVTLTLAAIGGFVVSMGMAVDANVLIFERMKEELMTHRTLGASVEAGFSRAWSAIWDSNLTTIIAAGILIWVGNTVAGGQQVKGFAITLALGIGVSMFTAIVVTRTLLRMFIKTGIGKRPMLFSPVGIPAPRTGEAKNV
jgi:preprotein translocase subunit SecD